MNYDKPEDNRFYEYGSTGQGAIKSSTRRLLTSAQAASYSKNKVLAGWNTSTKAINLNNFKM